MIYELYPNHNRDTFFHLCNCVLILTDLSGGYNTKIVTKHIKKAFKNIGCVTHSVTNVPQTNNTSISGMNEE